MIGYYNYAVILTYISMLISFGGISYVIDNKIVAACVCLLLSGICDTFDGKIAQTKERTQHEKRFGIQLDSLADTVCFGVLPATIRLAWFNVDEEKRQDSASKCREFYTGMPVTVSAFILPIVLALANISGNSMLIPGTITLLVLAFAFIAPIKVPKLNFSIGHQKNNEQEDHRE